MTISAIARQVDEATHSMTPKTLPNSLPPVPSFHPEMLPEELRSYVLDVSQRIQCPPEYCAVSALALLSG
ncbi:hypothetical protein, partial [Halomonas sp. Mc5H-6]